MANVTIIQRLELIELFERQGRSADFSTLDNKSYQNVFQALFSMALAEKRVLASTRKGIRQPSSSYLQNVGEAIRLVAAHGCTKLKRNTVNSLVYHITDTLPGADNHLTEPLVASYVKALALILTYAPNVEHIATVNSATWLACVDFCVEMLLRSMESELQIPGTAPPFSGGSNPSTQRNPFSKIHNPVLVELLRCLLGLVSASNAPLLKKANEITSVVLRLLQQHVVVPEIFGIINFILLGVQADNLTLSESLSVEVVPHLVLWWQSPHVNKANDDLTKIMKDEIIRCIFCTHLHLLRLVVKNEHHAILQHVTSLANVLRDEYCKQSAVSLLNMEDLLLNSSKLPTYHMQTQTFALRWQSSQGERRWGFVQSLAILESIIFEAAACLRPSDDNPERKRRRISPPLSRLQPDSLCRDRTSQILALQLVPFVLDLIDISSEGIEQLVKSILPLVNSEHPEISSWAMLALASCALRSKSIAHDPEMWRPVWHNSVRFISQSVTCRAACALLSVLLEAECLPSTTISDDIYSIISTGMGSSSGPAILVDSSIGLICRLLHFCNTYRPNTSQKTALDIIRWVMDKWKPVDPGPAKFTLPTEISSLICFCCGCLPYEPNVELAVPGGTILHGWRTVVESEPLMRFLLLLNEAPLRRCNWPQTGKEKAKSTVRQLSDTSNFQATKQLVFELLIPKLEAAAALAEGWAKTNRGDFSSLASKDKDELAIPITLDRLNSQMSFCITASLLVPELYRVSSSHSRTLEQTLFKAVDTMIETILKSSHVESFVEVIQYCIRPVLPGTTTSDISKMINQVPLLSRLVAHVSDALLKKQKSLPSWIDCDLMDLDDKLASQTVSERSVATDGSVPRSNTAIALSPDVYLATTSLRIHFLASIARDPQQIGLLPPDFREYVLGLSIAEFLMGSPFMLELLGGDLVVNSVDGQKLLKKAASIIENQPFLCCQAAQCLCLEFMRYLSAAGSDRSSVLHSLISQLYQYFLQTPTRNNMLSVPSQIELAKLTFHFLQVGADFNNGQRDEGYRASLLQIMNDGSTVVKYFVSTILPDLFSLYVLKTHDDMFITILGVLPDDEQDSVGIACRVFALAELACRWPSLLRRCVYHIFESPGDINDSVGYGTRALAKIATAIGLSHPKELFKLFESQLLYTWLQTDSLNQIPYWIFGFESILDLLTESKNEVVALMAMRDQQEELAGVATSLGVNTATLIGDAFGKVMGYSIVYDLFESRQDHVAAEARLKNILGKEKFTELLYVNLSDILGVIFQAYDDVTDISRAQKYFSANDQIKHGLEILSQILNICSSGVAPPPSQQPHFLGKYLPKLLVYLSATTKWELSAIWNPAVVVAVCRQLINTIHPALGSLHACTVIRRLRAVIALAGDIPGAGYPLEMLLHTICPFIVDPECADDALGITQYLLGRGVHYLQTNPSFLAGYAVSVLSSLRVFLDSTQPSTTQESQFKATKEKAQHFHAWLAKYLAEYESPEFDHDELGTAFRSITLSASHICSSGNAELGTHESKLLLQILMDGQRKQKLLNDSARQLVLRTLCNDFRIPPCNQDVVRTDLEAMQLSAQVWQSCQFPSLSDSYLAWAGRVVGRAFGATGELNAQILRESTITDHALHSPKLVLLGFLRDLVTHTESWIAGLAESTLRVIITSAFRADDKNFAALAQNSLGEPMTIASSWADLEVPPSDRSALAPMLPSTALAPNLIQDASWASVVGTYLAQLVPNSSVLYAIAPMTSRVGEFARRALPFILHLVLLSQAGREQISKQSISAAFKEWLDQSTTGAKRNIKLIVGIVMYLRTQPYPGETSIADRVNWLDLNLYQVATAAASCEMFKTALLLAELSHTEAVKSAKRQSSGDSKPDSAELLLRIYTNTDDPDAYYGLPQDPSLEGVLAQSEYEGDGETSIALRSAQLYTHIRLHDSALEDDIDNLARNLGGLGLPGLSQPLLQSSLNTASSRPLGIVFENARRLEQWNLPAPISSENHAVLLYTAYQDVYHARKAANISKAVCSGLGMGMKSLAAEGQHISSLRQKLGVLASLFELDEVLSVTSQQDMDQVLESYRARSSWMRRGRYEDVRQILSSRITTFSMLEHHTGGALMNKISVSDARLDSIRSIMIASQVYRFHKATQECDNLTTALRNLLNPSISLGLDVHAAIRLEVANSLWDHKKMIPSIRLLQITEKDLSSLQKQSLPVSKVALLATIAERVSAARLETPGSIQKNYLEPAVHELQGKHEGKEAGQVYHQFAVFCDEQLQDPNDLEDLDRLRSLRKGKSDEVNELRVLISETTNAQQKARFTRHLNRAKQWLILDEQELARVEQTRAKLIQGSLENYLLSLAASDEYNSDALRFTAIWMEQANDETSNKTVKRHLKNVPTRKFAGLMNQLSSRLLDQSTVFQKCLAGLIIGICVDHPFHGMYQIWTASKAQPNPKDDIAVSRLQASTKIALNLSKTRHVAQTWHAIDRTNTAYHKLAVEQNKDQYVSGRKLSIQSSPAGSHLSSSLNKYQIPPCTYQLDLSPAYDYSKAPLVTKLEAFMSIASGISAPKIITAVASDGRRYKQLVKGGNDDLRQDAIMEQVFSSVSSALRLHRQAQQRNLSIRTYKVVPLTASSGVIEFVSNTIPLNDFLMPAHERYFPKDLKNQECRKQISAAQNRGIESRLHAFRSVTDKFHPVLHYFFLEHFQDANEWYEKRLAYTRSTAAISIVGHVIGLGDRHGHNILLDKQSGEVVHIDLGVCFEQGRILPVPEVIPFRLTRDIVDGMGITGTEGVFRRCCEFTLDALREEQYWILTVLDVLRHDPLYAWIVSPVRLSRLQAAHDGAANANASTATDTTANATDQQLKIGNANTAAAANEQADRALKVVRMKLSKTMSVNATVNDLINRATDERNLAVLYSGWAAYA